MTDSHPTPPSDRYKAFVLRISRTGCLQQRWQATLVEVSSGDKYSFATTDALADFLNRMTAGQSVHGAQSTQESQ